MPVYVPTPKHRKDSFFSCDWRKIERNDRARLYTYVVSHEASTRAAGAHGGALGRAGVEVIRVLLFNFLNIESGRLDPSLEAIAKATRYCVTTVREAIKRIEASGILEHTRRLVRRFVAVACPWTGATRQEIRAVQTSNGYRFTSLFLKLATGLKSPQNPPKCSDSKSRLETNPIYNSKPLPLDQQPSEALTEALERLGRAMNARAARA